MTRFFLVLTSCLFCFGLSAKEVHPCKTDIEKLCKDVKPGKFGIMKCLKDHETELSPECKTKTAEVKGKMKAFHETCKEDRDKFCKDVKPGKGRVKTCMNNNIDKLTPACKAEMEKIK